MPSARYVVVFILSGYGQHVTPMVWLEIDNAAPVASARGAGLLNNGSSVTTRNSSNQSANHK